MALGAVGQGDKQVLRVREVGNVELTEDLPTVGHEFTSGITEESGHVADGLSVSILGVSVVMNALRLRRFRDRLFIRERRFEMNKTVMIEGMKCEHCAAFVTKALQAVEGVESVSVDLKTKKAEVKTTGDVPDDVLKNAVAGAGFEVAGIKDA